MKSCLIGHTGFVGQSLLRGAAFADLYHSQNIEAIRKKSYGLVVCAGAPAAKWVANRRPDEDSANLKRLIGCLETVTAGRFVLISTVDVYQSPYQVDEETPVDPETVDPYGRHRFYLEEFVRSRFPAHTVVRLPGLFGEGMKKNFIYDLLHANALDYTHCDSVFQFYHTARLWPDLQVVLAKGLSLVNFATEPVTAAEVARTCFGIQFTNRTERPPARYDMWTRHADAFGRPQSRYMQTRGEVLAEIAAFVDAMKARRGQ